MTKEEQIEEISNIITEVAFVQAHEENGDENLSDIVATAIYNAGYRKIDDDCAVITKDELKQYKVQAVKEFAEKLKMAFFYEFDEIVPSIMSDKIDELIKEFEK